MRLPWGRVEVHGESMLPTLAPGDWLLVHWARRSRPGRVRVRPGRLVVLRRPDRPDLLVVKRLADRLPDGRVWVLGDNPRFSDDSRLFGPLPPAAILGRVLLRYGRAGSGFAPGFPPSHR